MRHLKHYDGSTIAERDPEWVHTTPTYTAEDCTITMLGRLAYTPDAFVPGIATVHKWIEHHTMGRLRRVLLSLDRAVYLTNGGLDARRIPFVWIAPRRPDAPSLDAAGTPSTDGPQGSGMLHHEEAHTEALGVMVTAPAGTSMRDMEQLLRDRGLIADDEGLNPHGNQHTTTHGRATA